jgi:hypothetical protein
MQGLDDFSFLAQGFPSLSVRGSLVQEKKSHRGEVLCWALKKEFLNKIMIISIKKLWFDDLLKT